MLIFDQLKKNDPQLRLLALVVFVGMFLLFAGLWWVQVVRARDYQAHLETQSFRTIRTPAVRGRILDRNGNVLAENRPNYSVSLYLEELRRAFATAYRAEAKQLVARKKLAMAEHEKRLRRKLTDKERKQFRISSDESALLWRKARYGVASNVVVQICQRVQQPVNLTETNFHRHYHGRPYIPYPVLKNLNATNIARFQEQCSSLPGADLEVRSTRVYPHDKTASHLLGYVRSDDSSAEGEEAYFSYRLPDFRGVVGIEGGYDAQLRGRAGAKSVLVNNMGFRQTETFWNTAAAGSNVVLTLDLDLQRAAERAMARYAGNQARGAIVVMDVNTGDVLALASAPSYNPNHYVQGFPPGEAERLADPVFRPQINRATQENYAPGSIFKPIVGLACLEAGLNPKETIHNPGHIYVGKRFIDDQASAGDYDFRRAIVKSSNTYFITNGLRYRVIERVIALGQRLHLGERTGLPTRQETAGILPSLKDVRSGWFDGDTANICIGQGKIAVSPLQMAVMTSALANGGKVLLPRLVQRIESQDPAFPEPMEPPSGQVRDHLGVRPQHLQTLREAMLDETENPEGTGIRVLVPGLRICGKTGTAQVMDERNHPKGQNLWFISFAPYERPRYAVVVMVEGEGSGGSVCAPIASDIYAAIQKKEASKQTRAVVQAR